MPVIGCYIKEKYINDDKGNIIDTKEITMKKKQHKYPKTYVECCEILYPGENFQIVAQRSKGHKGEILFYLQKLLFAHNHQFS